jgi:hypothetical protein
MVGKQRLYRYVVPTDPSRWRAMAPERRRDRVQTGLRINENLRAKLEAAAQRNELSFNGEVVQRLERSLQDEVHGGVVFGDHATFSLLSLFARFVRATEEVEKRRWTDPEGREVLLKAIRRFEELVKVWPNTRNFPDSYPHEDVAWWVRHGKGGEEEENK